MKWPMGATTGRPPSREFLKFCMLDNVKTFGLPMYHPRTTETQATSQIPDKNTGILSFVNKYKFTIQAI